MSKNIKRYQLRFVVLLLSVAFSIGAISETAYAAYLEQAVTISAVDQNGEERLPMTAVEFEEGETAYDVLERESERQKKPLKSSESEWGVYLEAIDGLEGEGTYFWSFLENGASSQVGSSSYLLNHGDNIRFTYVSWEEDYSLPVTIEVKTEDGEIIIENSELVLQEGATAYDALVQVAKETSKSLNIAIHDQWLTSISNIGDVELDPQSEYWNVSVNGETLQVGAVAYDLSAGDHVSFKVESFMLPTDEIEENLSGNADEVVSGESQDVVTSGEIPNESVHEDVNFEFDVSSEIQKIFNRLQAQSTTFTLGDEWLTWSYAQNKKEIPASYFDELAKKILENEGILRSLEMQKAVITLSLAGYDATDFAGYNLVESMLENSMSSLINFKGYTLLALDSGRYTVEEGARQQLIAEILALELEGGGWALSQEKASPDITGMILSALAPYKEKTIIKEAIERAVLRLSADQKNHGGFDIALNGGDASESLSQTIIGLTAVGIDPSSDHFTKEKNLIEHLLDFSDGNGEYKHLVSDATTSKIATEQALLALTAYERFNQKQPSVYSGQVTKKYENENNITDVPVEDKTSTKVKENSKVTPVENTTENSVESVGRIAEKQELELPQTGGASFKFIVSGALIVTGGLILRKRYVR